MSGGFFRGTSADQDTRFSNKQAKLLKSQKFAPELENLVDMTKVKMDVLKPWIAKRVTELIGFEDEVLINFIYSLLEGKAVNGKQVQIQLTGFMERNTGKFMKELWALLLSAQQNVSGIPQQFLDAKEEETMKKEAETDHKSNEIRKKEKGNQELEEEKSKMDGDGAKPRDMNFTLKHDAGSMAQRADDKDRYRRNGQRRSSRGSRSPGSSQHSPSTRQKHLSPVKSNSRSYSDERQRSRSISGTPPSRGRSASSERQDRSAPRRSLTPRRRHITRCSPSPLRRSSHMRRRSRSHSRRRSPSPARFRVHSPRRQRSRSPLHRRSRSPVRRRSRTPIRRSPVRYRSRTPLRRRSSSPMQGRSPSLIRGRSPSFRRRRSPSPVHRRSPSPVHRGPRSLLRRRSPSPRHRSPSPPRRRHQRSMSRSLSPERRRPSMLCRKRSFTPDGSSPLRESSSPSHIRPNSLSPVGEGSPRSMRSPRKSPGERTRHEKYSSTHRASPIERSERSENRKGRSTERRPIVSLRSPQRDMLDRSEVHGKSRGLSPSMENSPVGSDVSRGRSDSEEQRSMSPCGSPCHKRGRIVQPKSPSPLRKAAVPKAHHESSSVDVENNFSSREVGLPRHRSSGKTSPVPKDSKDALDSVENHGLADRTKSRKILSNSDRLHDTANLKEYHGRSDLSTTSKTSLSVKNKDSYDDGARAKYKKLDRLDDSKGDNQISDSEGLRKLARKSEKNGLMDSPSKEADELRGKVRESRKQKRSERREEESNDYSSSDSYEERKEAKRRRRDEKKLKKEERRRRRENKQRKKDEKRAEKLKLKSNDADLAHNHSEDESVRRRESKASNIKETASEQKKLEIELREKALESLRARKGFGN